MFLIFLTSNDERQFRVEADRGHVLRVPIQRLDARLVLIVPDSDGVIVGARNQVRLLATVEVVNRVHLQMECVR